MKAREAKIPAGVRGILLTKAGARVVQLYEATGREEEAVESRKPDPAGRRGRPVEALRRRRAVPPPIAGTAGEPGASPPDNGFVLQSRDVVAPPKNGFVLSSCQVEVVTAPESGFVLQNSGVITSPKNGFVLSSRDVETVATPENGFVLSSGQVVTAAENGFVRYFRGLDRVRAMESGFVPQFCEVIAPTGIGLVPSSREPGGSVAARGGTGSLGGPGDGVRSFMVARGLGRFEGASRPPPLYIFRKFAAV